MTDIADWCPLPDGKRGQLIRAWTKGANTGRCSVCDHQLTGYRGGIACVRVAHLDGSVEPLKGWGHLDCVQRFFTSEVDTWTWVTQRDLLEKLREEKTLIVRYDDRRRPKLDLQWGYFEEVA